MKKVRDLIEWTPLTSTLFGKFYEEILRCWLRDQGYRVFEYKPRIYWEKQPILDKRQISSDLCLKLLKKLQRIKSEKKKRWIIPDGMLEKNGHYYVWEAKHSIPDLWFDPLRNRVLTWPWLLSKKVTYQREDYDLSGIIIFWWREATEKGEPSHKELLNELQECLKPLELKIIYIRNILEDCIKKKPSWYVEIIKQKRDMVDSFFKELVGNDA